MIDYFRTLETFETAWILAVGILFAGVLLWDDKPGLKRLFKK